MPASPGHVREPDCRNKQKRFRGSVGENVKNAGRHSRLSSHPDSHIDIPDLSHGGKRNHSPDIILLNRIQGTEDHSHQAEGEQCVDYSGIVIHVKAQHPVNNLDQQKYVAFGYKAGENRS